MKNNKIDSTAIISNKAKIGKNVKIGAYSIIGDNVSIGDNTIIKSHIVIDGNTHIGSNNVIFPFVSIGQEPQDLKFEGEESKIIIGNNNKIREYVTINPGTKSGNMLTSVGNNCLIMIGSHIAHDCIIRDNVILANNATLAGHVEIDNDAIIGGMSAIHQFVCIGRGSMIGGMSGVENDVIPFSIVIGERSNLAGLNLLGLKRKGVNRNLINSLRGFYKKLFCNDKDFYKNLDLLKNEYKNDDLSMEIIDFIEKDRKRPICMPKNKNL